MSAARPRVVLVMVECVCADADVPALELAAEQWAQSVRHRVSGDAITHGAGEVVIDGTTSTIAATLTLAAENLSG